MTDLMKRRRQRTRFWNVVVIVGLLLFLVGEAYSIAAGWGVGVVGHHSINVLP